MKYKSNKAGEWVQPARVYRMMCCDCGLVHVIHFRIFGGKIRFKVYRDNRATGQARRKRK